MYTESAKVGGQHFVLAVLIEHVQKQNWASAGLRNGHIGYIQMQKGRHLFNCNQTLHQRLIPPQRGLQPDE